MTDQRSRPDDDTPIEPDELETALRVFEKLDSLPVEHPDSLKVQQATAGLYKSVKRRRRLEKRREQLEHDAAITALTATAAPGRIDDETEGLPLVSEAKGAIAGVLIEPRACYICKQPYTRGRRLLPPALPRLRRLQPRPPRRDHRPVRQAGAADRWPREDRHVHRPPPPPRRRRHHDHDPVSRMTPCAGSRRCPTATTGSTGSTSSASTCVTPAR